MLKKGRLPPEQSPGAKWPPRGTLSRILIGANRFHLAGVILTLLLALPAGLASAADRDCAFVSVKQLAGALPGDAWIVFGPAKAYPESGSVNRLKAVAAKIYSKM